MLTSEKDIVEKLFNCGWWCRWQLCWQLSTIAETAVAELYMGTSRFAELFAQFMLFVYCISNYSFFMGST